MVDDAPRCSVLSAERGESMLGSAFEQSGVLLVEQPGPWGHAGLRESRFDPRTARALEERASRSDLRVLAVRRPGRSPDDQPRRWGLSLDGAVYWSSFERDEQLLDVPLDGSAGTVHTADTEPLYLVCAHSKRDVCCAVRGRPLAKALEQLRPGRVWECSHTGGHRFAPNVLVLPLGALYGRVEPGGVDELVALSETGRVRPDLLRGLIGYSPVEQAALGHAMQTLRVTSPAEFAVAGSAELAPDQWTVRLLHEGAQYDVELSVATADVTFTSCAKPGPKPQLCIEPTGMARL